MDDLRERLIAIVDGWMNPEWRETSEGCVDAVLDEIAMTHRLVPLGDDEAR